MTSFAAAFRPIIAVGVHPRALCLHALGGGSNRELCDRTLGCKCAGHEFCHPVEIAASSTQAQGQRASAAKTNQQLRVARRTRQRVLPSPLPHIRHEYLHHAILRAHSSRADPLVRTRVVSRTRCASFFDSLPAPRQCDIDKPHPYLFDAVAGILCGPCVHRINFRREGLRLLSQGRKLKRRADLISIGNGIVGKPPHPPPPPRLALSPPE